MNMHEQLLEELTRTIAGIVIGEIKKGIIEISLDDGREIEVIVRIKNDGDDK